MYDDFDDEETRRARMRTYEPDEPEPLGPGDPGYRQAPWAPGYDPGANWNNGTAPNPTDVWNMNTNSWDSHNKAMGATRDVDVDIAPPQRPRVEPPRTSGDGGNQPMFLPPAQAQPAPSIAQPTTQPPVLDEATRILLERLKLLSQPFDPQSDDTYKKTIAAYGLGQERDARRQRRVAAERAAAGGYGSSGALNTRIQGIAERQGQNESMFAAQTANERLRERDQQLVVAIQLARQMGQDDLANQLEQQRLRLSEVLGRGDLALRAELGRGQLGLGYDTLGFNYAQLANSANRDAILALLGGGG